MNVDNFENGKKRKNVQTTATDQHAQRRREHDNSATWMCFRDSAVAAASRGSNTQRERCRRAVPTHVQRYHRSQATYRGRERQRSVCVCYFRDVYPLTV